MAPSPAVVAAAPVAPDTAAAEEAARAAAERAAEEEAARAAAEHAAAEEAARAAAQAARAEAAAKAAEEAAAREEAAAAERAARLSRLVAPGAPAPKVRTEPAPVDAGADRRRATAPSSSPTSPGRRPPPTPISEAPSVALPPRRLIPSRSQPALAAPTAGPVRKGADGSSSLATVITIAERSGRTDLSSRLKASREKLRRTGVTVAVVGEFKKGKSNLVNALVNADVCPSDPVYATVVPIEVGYAEELTVTAESAIGDPDGGPTQAFEDPANLASERGNPDNSRGLSRVTIGLPRRLLATGLTIMDTPGVGGLDSAAGARALASLDAADGVMFVTDCSQELTAPEMTYLQAARERCDSVVCVMTKLDLYQHAPTMREVNRRHLDAAGLTDVPLVAVSSVLHLLALVEERPGARGGVGLRGAVQRCSTRRSGTRLGAVVWPTPGSSWPRSPPTSRSRWRSSTRPPARRRARNGRCCDWPSRPIGCASSATPPDGGSSASTRASRTSSATSITTCATARAS